MQLTPDQQRAAYASGSVAVRAGAGTGKTHMLTQRYLHHLTVDGLRPLEIVAVTFTERAAAELRARIRAAVMGEPTLPQDFLFEIEASQISTLHALAARICREHPDEAGVPPDFTVLDEMEGGLWLAEHVDEAIARLPPEVLALLPYTRLRACLNVLLEDPEVATKALEVGVESWEALVRSRREQAKQVFAGREWREARALLHAYRGAPDDKRELARRHALEAVAALEAGRVQEGLVHLAQVTLRGGRQAAWPQGGFEEVKEAITVVRDCVEAAIREGLTLDLGAADEALARSLPAVRQAFATVYAHLQQAKREARVLAFTDLELCALRALAHANVRRHYAQRWRAVLVDEVQDTSPVQAHLLEALTETATLTIVGDEKQSIYGFRGADVRMFESLQARVVQAGGERVSLSACFRIHQPLMTLLNATTAPLLEALHQPLDAVRDAPDEGPHLQVFVVRSEEKANKAERQVTEARHLAKLILNLIETQVPIYDKTTGRHRPVGPGDMAILTRAWKPLDVYNEVLPALGVPTVHSGGGNLLATREAKDALAALAFLADTCDDLSLAALLRSPYFALSDRTLAAIAKVTPQGGSWWETLREAPPDEARAALSVLQALVQARSGDPPSRLLQRLDALTGYTAVIGNLPGASRRLADYRALVELVRQLEPGHDTFAVMRRLKRLVRAEVAVPRPTLQAEDAVTLMTVHRAKGLEWPVVILADLDYAPSAASPPVLMDAALGVALKLADDEGEVLEPVLYKVLKGDRAKREAEELRRVLYVGLTRAQDRLYLSAASDSGGAFELLGPCLEVAGIRAVDVPHTSDSAAYPEHGELPQKSLETSGNLWQADVMWLGAEGDAVTAERSEEQGAAEPKGSWSQVVELFELSEAERWLPLLKALEAAGIRPPDLDACLAPLTRAGIATPAQAILAWSHVALVERGTPEGTYDLPVIVVSENEPHGAIEALRPYLGSGA